MGCCSCKTTNEDGRSAKSLAKAYQLSDKQLAEYKKIFTQFDQNGDGRISATELGLVMESIGRKYSMEKLTDMIESVDNNHSGAIEFEEFVQILTANPIDGFGGFSDEQVSVTFDKFDKDKDGYITYDELQQTLGQLGLKLNEKEAKNMLSEIDCDKDGKVNKFGVPQFTEPLHRGQKLNWNYPINLIGEKVTDPVIHICEVCDLPILIYGRILPCKHVFCYDCSSKAEKQCPRCKDPVNRIERCELGTIFLCTWGAPRHSHEGCRRTYLSQRDLQAHVNHRHAAQQKVANAVTGNTLNSPPTAPMVTVAQQQQQAVLNSMQPPVAAEQQTTTFSAQQVAHIRQQLSQQQQQRSNMRNNLITIPLQNDSGRMDRRLRQPFR